MFKRSGFIAIFTMLIFSLGCSSGEKKAELILKPSCLNCEFPNIEGRSFQEYIGDAKWMIRRGRINYPYVKPAPEWAVDMVAPFIVKPVEKCQRGSNGKWKKGALLIHGLWDSPYIMKQIAKKLSEDCYISYGILLPGHGTRPADVKNVGYAEWVKAANFGFNRLSEVAENIAVGGMSAGGTLSIKLALNNREAVKGVMLFSPAVALPTGAGTLSALSSVLTSWVFGSKNRLNIDAAKYESLALNGVSQLKKIMSENSNLMDEMAKTGGKLPPTFMAVSMADASVSSKASLKMFSEMAPAGSFARIYIHDDEAKADAMKILEKKSHNMWGVIDSTKFMKNVISLSHVALTFPADDPHYGIKPAAKGGIEPYRHCTHFKPDDNVYFNSDFKKVCQKMPAEPSDWWKCACLPNDSANICYGETVGLFGKHSCGDSKEAVRRRTTFNPDFDGMMKKAIAVMDGAIN